MTSSETNRNHQKARFWYSPSTHIYLILVAIMVVLTGLATILPLAVNQGQQVSWITVIVVAVLGWVGVILTPKAGFPEMLEPVISTRQRVWVPFIGGLGLGIIMVIFDLISPLGTDIQTQFPDSLIVFTLAGLIEEIVVHLFLTTLLIWLISGVLLKNRYQTPVFWIVAIGLGIAYWLLQISAILTYFPEKFSVMLAGQMLFIIATTITMGAYFFRKSGFLAALALRYGFYLIWHIIWAGGIGLVRYFM